MHTDTSAKTFHRNRPQRRSSSCFKLLAALLLLTVLALPAHARWIRVGLMTGVSSAAVSGKGLQGHSDGHLTYLPEKFTAVPQGKSVVINGKAYASPLVITPTRSMITCGSTAYEGELVLRVKSGKLTVINRLDIEKYLRGVLGYEINPKWAPAALQAQAVISRTFAQAQMGRHESAGYDVCPNDHCQVYKGANVHSASTDAAINKTRGMVLTYNGALAQTFFHSDSGGATSDVADVWGKPIPYLTVREEPFPSESKNAAWELELTRAEIQNALAKKGLGVGTLQNMSISRRDAAGRPTMLTFSGTGGVKSISSAAFRMAIGAKKLRSTFFDFSPSGPAAGRATASSYMALRSAPKKSEPEVPLTPLTPEEEKQLKALIAQKKFTVDERLDMMLYPERRRKYLARFAPEETAVAQSQPQAPSAKGAAPAAKAPARIPATKRTAAVPPSAKNDASAPLILSADLSSGSVVLYGRGWGHGVGLSQWGAKAMADHGWSMKEILEFYYPGTAIQTR